MLFQADQLRRQSSRGEASPYLSPLLRFKPAVFLLIIIEKNLPVKHQLFTFDAILGITTGSSIVHE